MNWTDKINLTLISATGATVIWMFSTFASASDLERIEYTLLKSEIRDIRRDLMDPGINSDTKRYLEEDLEKLIDDLCRIAPNDRECTRKD